MFQRTYIPSNCFSVVQQSPFTYVFLAYIIDPHDHIIAILIGSAFFLHFYCQLSLITNSNTGSYLCVIYYGRHVCGNKYWDWTNEAGQFSSPQFPRSWPGMYF